MICERCRGEAFFAYGRTLFGKKIIVCYKCAKEIDEEENQKDEKKEEMKNNVLRDLVAEMDELERNYNESIRKRGKLQDQVDVLTMQLQKVSNIEPYLEETLGALNEMRKERDALRVLLRGIGTEVEDKRKVYVWEEPK